MTRAFFSQNHLLTKIFIGSFIAHLFCAWALFFFSDFPLLNANKPRQIRVRSFSLRSVKEKKERKIDLSSLKEEKIEEVKPEFQIEKEIKEEKKTIKKESVRPASEAKREIVKKKVEKKKKKAQNKPKEKSRETKNEEGKGKNKRKELLAQAQNKLAQARKQSETKEAKAEPISSVEEEAINSLSTLSVEALEVDKSLSAEEAYQRLLVARLQFSLKLPERGEVEIKLRLNRLGKIEEAEALKAESQLNRHYVESQLSSLDFPSFGAAFRGEASHVFFISLRSKDD